MMGTKTRQFTPVPAVTLAELVPADHFYRHLEQVLNLTFVRQWVQDDYFPHLPGYAPCCPACYGWGEWRDHTAGLVIHLLPDGWWLICCCCWTSQKLYEKGMIPRRVRVLYSGGGIVARLWWQTREARTVVQERNQSSSEAPPHGRRVR